MNLINNIYNVNTNAIDGGGIGGGGGDKINSIESPISLTNLDTWKIPQYYSLSYQMIGTIFQGIIFIVGVLGNVMVVIVVLRSRSMRTPTNCYLVSLAIADTMVLLASVPNEIISYYLLGDRWIWGPFGCALFIFLQYLGINASSLSIAAFTVERYIAICHPMLAHKLCTVRRAKRIIMYVWMFATTYCAPWLFLTKTERINYLWINKEIYTCKFKLNREFYKGYYLTDIVLFYILPLLISCILYALIARILYHMSMCMDFTYKIYVVKMLAVVVAVFATLWLPYRALVVYNSFSFPPYMELWYLMFAKTMIFVNSAINPIIYSACSMKFRREFKRMLTCGQKKRHRSNIGGNYRYGAGTARQAAIKSSGGGGGGGICGTNDSMTFTMGPDTNQLSNKPINKCRRTSSSSSPSPSSGGDRNNNVYRNDFKIKNLSKKQQSSTIVTICATQPITDQSNIEHNDDDDDDDNNVPTILITTTSDNDKQQSLTKINQQNSIDNQQQQQMIRLKSRSLTNGDHSNDDNQTNSTTTTTMTTTTVATTIKTTASIAAVYSDNNHDGNLFHTETINNDQQMEYQENQF
ncbi:thyrotropin-releasing hormone receptor-like [Dermatophagoides farinae]|uniref:Thyrotropin-releasing hormone receptor n=1 Tax=Dermatophagoides farinae TaxID=6954 RepID=A0A9D4NP34_DERFA|nr:thyrotropin-releasing hormone receptor-like [Dermatophagoides farinae]